MSETYKNSFSGYPVLSQESFKQAIESFVEMAKQQTLAPRKIQYFTSVENYKVGERNGWIDNEGRLTDKYYQDFYKTMDSMTAEERLKFYSSLTII